MRNISNITTYEKNCYERNKIEFVRTDENEEKDGMISEISDNIPNRFITIHHYKLLQANKKITDGLEAEKWINCYENYTFEENNRVIMLKVDLDITADILDYRNKSYPKALIKPKDCCKK